jgi:hypothetical protein
MRKTIASLIVLSSLAGAAMAQEATTAAPAPAPEAAPAPAAPTPAPAPEAAPAEQPTLPTTGDGAAVLSVLERVCVPAIRGGDLDQLAKSSGMKKDRKSGGWMTALGADKRYSMIVQPLGANRDVCQVEVHYAIDAEKPIINALNVWSFLHVPELRMQNNYVNVDADNIKRTKTTWEYFTDTSSIGLVFNQMKNPDGSPLNAKFDTAMVRYQERKF